MAIWLPPAPRFVRCASTASSSHLSARSAPDAVAHTHKISQETGFPAVAFRSDEEVLQFFEGFELVEPGLVDVREWHPEQEAPEVKIKLVGAVARKAG